LTVTFQRPELVKSSTGKSIENKNSQTKFSGFKILSETVQSTIGALQLTNEVASQGSLASSVGLFSISSLWSNAFAFLSKLIQIIEFTALMQFYNLSFDENLGIFLNALNEATTFELLTIPSNSYTKSVLNSVAAPSRGKLTKLDIPPYFIEDLGYPGIIMIVSLFLRLFR
jgi:hypothetical protein